MKTVYLKVASLLSLMIVLLIIDLLFDHENRKIFLGLNSAFSVVMYFLFQAASNLLISEEKTDNRGSRLRTLLGLGVCYVPIIALFSPSLTGDLEAFLAYSTPWTILSLIRKQWSRN